VGLRAELQRLAAGMDRDAAWAELWQGLHHQGDVCEASYAAVPHLVRIQGDRGDLDGNASVLIATIEIERHRRRNPPVPDWLVGWYESAWASVGEIALRDYRRVTDPLAARMMLAVMALCKGLTDIGTVAADFSEGETREMLTRYLSGGSRAVEAAEPANGHTIAPTGAEAGLDAESRSLNTALPLIAKPVGLGVESLESSHSDGQSPTPVGDLGVRQADKLWRCKQLAHYSGDRPVVEGAVEPNLDRVAADHRGEGVAPVVIFVGNALGLHLTMLALRGEHDRAMVVEDHLDVVNPAGGQVFEMLGTAHDHRGLLNGDKTKTPASAELAGVWIVSRAGGI
jgi:hypothetical protein